MFLWPFHFGWLLVLDLYKEDYLQIFKCVECPFDCAAFCGQWEGWNPINRFKATSWVAAVTPTDGPKVA